MAPLKVNLSKLIGSITKIGLTLYLSKIGASPETTDMLSGLGEGVISSFSKEKQTSLLSDFRKLVKASIRDTLEIHEFVFTPDQIEIITESILSVENMQDYLHDNSVELLRAQFINALDEIDYPYKSPNVELDIDSLLEPLLQRIYTGIREDSNLANLDTNITVHEILKIIKSRDDDLPTERIPKYLTDIAPYQSEKVLHREKDISALVEGLFNQKLTMITGIGGIGKTVLARAVCDVVKDRFNHIAWITYDRKLDNQLLELKIGLRNPEQHSRLLQIYEFLNTVEEPVLIILDNVNDIPPQEELDKLNAFSESVHVLITSRLPKIRGVNVYPIDFLPLEACLDVFYNYYTRDDEREYAELTQKIITTVNRHTLTVELIALTANWEAGSLPEVWKKMQQSGFAGFETEIESSWEPETHTIQENIKLLYNLTGMDSAKRRIMRIFSILPHSHPIPITIKDWMPCDIQDLKWLVERGWIQRIGNAFIIHQVVQESLRLQEKPSLEDCRGLIFTFSAEEYIPRNIVYTEALLRLALPDALINWFQPAPENPSFAHLLNTTASAHGNNFANFSQALAYYQKVLEINEKILGNQHPNTATSYNNLASIYDEIGDYNKSLVYYKKALDISEEILGQQHTDTANTYNNIAVVYHKMGDYSQALAYHHKALDIREKVLGERHPDTANSYNNIAVVYKDLADYHHALEYSNKALEINEITLGKQHPYTSNTYNNIAIIYHKMGDYTQALVYHQKALDICEKVLGMQHPDTATTYNNLALVYNDMRDYPQSLAYYQKALFIRENVLGKHHPSTANTYNNLAGVYDDMGDYPQALTHYHKALRVCERVLGEQHPNTATAYNNIGLIFHEMEDYTQALAYFQQALNIYEKALGEQHPDIANSNNNIAVVYHTMRDYSQALVYYHKALNIYESVFGEQHPSTTNTCNNIALVYQTQENYTKALSYYRKLYFNFFRLGIDNANTKIVKHNLALVFQKSSLSSMPFEIWLQEQLDQQES